MTSAPRSSVALALGQDRSSTTVFRGSTASASTTRPCTGYPAVGRLRDGDLVKLDVTAELDGFYADACVSVPVGRPRASAARLSATARRALHNAMAAAHAGAPLN